MTFLNVPMLFLASGAYPTTMVFSKKGVAWIIVKALWFLMLAGPA
jgi:hypothetical protein